MASDQPTNNPDELDRRRKAAQLDRIVDWTQPKPESDQTKQREDTVDAA